MDNPPFSDFFGAPKINYSQLDKLARNSPELIVWTAPVMFEFVLLEWFISYKQDKHLYERAETLGSILVGVGNVAIAFVLKFTLLYLVVLVYNAVTWRLHFSWWMFLPCYILFDFCSYWAHRV